MKMRIAFLTSLLFCWLTEMQAIELTISLDTSGVTISTVKGSFHGSLYVEQFRWNRWCRIDTLGENVSWHDTTLTGKAYLHSGLNQLRLTAVPSNPYMHNVSSSLLNVETQIECRMYSRCNGDYEFSTPTYWEIRNEQDSLLYSGYGTFIRHKQYPNGRYSLYYNHSWTQFYSYSEKDRFRSKPVKRSLFSSR